MKAWIRRQLGTLLRLATVPRPDASTAEPVRFRWCEGRLAKDTEPLVAELAAAAPWDVASARSWLASQSYRPLWLARLDENSDYAELLDPNGNPLHPGRQPDAPWRVALPGFFEGEATAVESAYLVAASEGIDRFVLGNLGVDAVAAPEERLTIYRSDRFRREAPGGELRPLAPGLLTKRLPPERRRDANADEDCRRGAYESDIALPLPLEVEVFDPSRVRRSGPPSRAPRILVLAPFLARGGAEQTLHSTCSQLTRDGDFEFAFATLAPHRRELGDRRRDFAQFAPLIYSLGDLLHPSAMYGALLSLVDALDIRLVYNANGSTLFYDFARRLRRDRPALPIVDHLYDHRIGYIEWYTPDLGAAIDCCVAENHVIAETLVEEHSWRRERAPVVWPCGRPEGEIPPASEHIQLRQRLRRELAIADDRVLVLTAARAHPQKRPLDWLRLAERLRDAPFEFLWVGGGDLEREL
ncbi:MAG: hypothetical protein ABIU84_04170, partial [Thermoanaerobaculia bacterium]